MSDQTPGEELLDQVDVEGDDLEQEETAKAGDPALDDPEFEDDEPEIEEEALVKRPAARKLHTRLKD